MSGRTGFDGQAAIRPQGFIFLYRSKRIRVRGFSRRLRRVYEDVNGFSAPQRGGGPPFERIRRITGYLVGTLNRSNDAKRAEAADRVKYSLGNYEQVLQRESPPQKGAN